MKSRNSSILLKFLIIIFTVVSCSDNEFSNYDNSNNNTHVRNSNSQSYQENSANQIAIILAEKWSSDEAFRKNLLKRLLSPEGLTKSVLIAEILTQELQYDQKWSDLGIELEDYNSIVSTLAESCNKVVAKIPKWAEVLWLGDESNATLFEFSYKNAKTLNFAFFPEGLNMETEELSGYQMNDNVLQDISKNDNVLPIFIKISDSYIYLDGEYKDKEGNYRLNYNIENLEVDQPCHPSNFLEECTLTHCNGFNLVDLTALHDYMNIACIEIQNNIDDNGNGRIDEINSVNYRGEILGGGPLGGGPLLEEICGNMMDDDLDGLDDCEDPDCCGLLPCSIACPEICDNDIDDDGDGAIDEEDEDCCSFYKQYYRDCKEDATFFRSYKFSDNSMIRILSDEPASRDNLTLKLDVIQLTPGAHTPLGKTVSGNLFGFCRSNVAETSTVEQNYFFLVRAENITTGDDDVLWIYNGYSVIVDRPLDRLLDLPMLDEWDGYQYGNLIRMLVTAENLKRVTTTTTSNTTNSTRQSVQWSVGATIGINPATDGTKSSAIDIGSGSWTFQGNFPVTYQSTYETTTARFYQEVKVIDTRFQYELGTFDLRYQDNNSTLYEVEMCDGNFVTHNGVGGTMRLGKIESVGTLTIGSDIEVYN